MGNWVFCCLFKVLLNVVGPKQEEHPIQQFCQYRLQTREGKGGCWSPVLTRLLVSQDNRLQLELIVCQVNYDQVGNQEEV